MIDKDEMRIGNYFLCDDKILWLSEIRHLKEVKEWVYEGWHEETKQRYSINFFEAEPIPLTPDILEKCGFEFADGFYDNGRLFLTEGHVYLAQVGNSHLLWICDCKYLHQLQNLYYALTNTNLIINNI